MLNFSIYYIETVDRKFYLQLCINYSNIVTASFYVISSAYQQYVMLILTTTTDIIYTSTMLNQVSLIN